MEDISSDALSSRQGSRLSVPESDIRAASYANIKTRPIDCEIVTIKCGSKSFQVHKQLLCDHSPYFKNLFEGGFKEANENITELEGVSELICEDFLQWLYVQAATKRQDTSCIGPISFSANLHLHILADRYDVPLLRDATIKSIHRLVHGSKKFPHHETVTEASRMFPETSAIRRLFVDAYAKSFRVENLQSAEVQRIRDGLPDGFIFTAFVRRAKFEQTTLGWSSTGYVPSVNHYLQGGDIEAKGQKCKTNSTYDSASSDSSDDFYDSSSDG